MYKRQAIFNASISFQKREDGLSHQIDLPGDIPRPDQIVSDALKAKEIVAATPGLNLKKILQFYLIFGLDIVDLRTPHLPQILSSEPLEPVFGFWFKFSDDIGDDPVLHRTLLAFISDKALMSVSLRPHGTSFNTHNIIGASLDHAMWFHTEIRVNQWIYYHIESPRSARARGLNHGKFYTEDGELIASTAQEGLIRVIGPKE